MPRFGTGRYLQVADDRDLTVVAQKDLGDDMPCGAVEASLLDLIQGAAQAPQVVVEISPTLDFASQVDSQRQQSQKTEQDQYRSWPRCVSSRLHDGAHGFPCRLSGYSS